MKTSSLNSIFGLGLFDFDRAIVEDTIKIANPYPYFNVDYSQWHNVMNVSGSDYKKRMNIIGFVYKDLDYAKKLFKYLNT